MSEYYVGEIRMFGGTFAPEGWALCNGQQLQIRDYDLLFNLIGTTYGGDGLNTFALPNLSSRIPIGRGGNNPLGATGGQESVTLTANQLPTHTHQAVASSSGGTASSPDGRVWAASSATPYGTGGTTVPMSSSATTSAGRSLPHENRPPFLAVTFIIALQGLYPSMP